MDKLISVFAILTFFTVTIISVTIVITTYKSTLSNTCTLDDYLKIMTSYISHNGVTEFKDEIPEKCKNHQPNSEQIARFRKSFANVVNSCDKIKGDIRKIIREPILTLFTSVNPDPTLLDLHDRTMKNWAALTPYVKLVMFTNDKKVAQKSRSRGWSILPITNSGLGGIPVLKTMFQQVMKNFTTPYYGFANADIIFTDSLLESLSSVKTILGPDKNVLLTGRRINVPRLANKDLVSYGHIERVAKERGKMFIISSEDYFITTNKFPWQDVPDLIIARPAYDNWLVAYARCTGITVVDTTQTILAVHQTTDEGDKASHHHISANYNDLLLVNHQLKRDYMKGYITCPEWNSYHNLCGDIDIAKRKSIPEFCKC